VEFEGEYYRIPKSIIGPKPVQKPRPPIFLAGYVPAALRRVAQYGDGWMPVGIPLGGVAQMFDGIKGMAQEFGRDPEKLDLLVRANLEFSDTSMDNERADFTGTLEQIKGDIAATQELGATDLLFDVQFSSGADSVDQMVEWMEQLRELAR